jgi:hypothetical protein
MFFPGNLFLNSVTFSKHSGMNFCPPLPGLTVMTSSRSAALPRSSVMTDEGVSGEMARPARMLCEWMRSMTLAGSSDLSARI